MRFKNFSSKEKEHLCIRSTEFVGRDQIREKFVFLGGYYDVKIYFEK